METQQMADMVFKTGDITAWDCALDDRPKAVTATEWPDLPQIEAFAPTPLNVGMACRLRAQDGSDIAFVLNPVAARYLAISIFTSGMKGGWLDERGNVIHPETPQFNS
jgi:hypothetical protein